MLNMQTCWLWSFVRLNGHFSSIFSLAFSPNGEFLASASQDGTICVWSVSTGKRIKILTGHSSWVYSVVFSPNGEYLASGSYKEIKLWEVPSGTLLKTLIGHSNSVTSVIFSPKGDYLASGSEDFTISVWRVSSG